MDKELLQKYKERNPIKYEQKFGKQDKVDESVETPKKKNLLKKIING